MKRLRSTINSAPSNSFDNKELVSRLLVRVRSEKIKSKKAEENHLGALSKTDRLDFETDIQKAFENNDFSLWYQPKIDLHNGKIVALESLTRWTHPTMGMVPPTQIVTIIEKLGLGVPFTEWAIQNIRTMQRKWQKKKLPSLRTAINISTKQLEIQQLEKIISQIIGNSERDLTLLEIELAEESLVHQGEAALTSLNQLKKMGVSISISELRSDCSFLAHLTKYPIDIIKIDRFLIKNIQADSPEISFIKSITILANVLGMNVVVEGIETLDQYRILHDLGCDVGQGFLFSQALPIEDLEMLILTNQSLTPYLESPMTTTY